jgi:peptidyl-prolyl cis-trans isomerase SurA
MKNVSIFTRPRAILLKCCIAMTLLLSVAVLPQQLFAQSEPEMIDRLIAVVGNQPILESEVFQNAQSIALQQGMDILKEQAKFDELKQAVLKEMINQKVLLAKAREDTVTVESRAVDRELDTRLQALVKNVGTEQKLEELYGYSISRIKRQYRQMVEDGLIVERIKAMHLGDLSVSRMEVERYFKDHPEDFPQMKDAVEISHILLEISKAPAEVRARARADSIYTAIKEGAIFDSLTLQLSDDPGTAKKFGSVGWTQRGDLLSEYETAAFALKVGEISRPVRTQYGFHIIRLDDTQEDKIKTSQILVKIKALPEDEQATLDSLNSIRAILLAGKPFEEAARGYSKDVESSGRGGYLGWFQLDEMPADFKVVVDTLQVGDVSKPFKTQYGYHVVKMTNKRAARDVAIDQDWELISQRALNAKREKEYTRWLEELKTRYFIEIKS